MSDPKRLVDELAPSDVAARLIASAFEDAPSREVRARVAGAVGLTAVTLAAGKSAAAGVVGATATASVAAPATATTAAATTTGGAVATKVVAATAAPASKTAAAGIFGLLGAKGIWIASAVGALAISTGVASIAIGTANESSPGLASAPSATSPLQRQLAPTSSPSSVTSVPPPTETSAPEADVREVPSAPIVEQVTPPAPPKASPSTTVAAPPLASASPSPSMPSAPTTISEEVRQVDAARTALRGGDPNGCLRALDRYDANYAGGVLSLEANVLRAEAMVQAGRVAEGRSLAARLLKSAPSGPHAARLNKLIGVESPDPRP